MVEITVRELKTQKWLQLIQECEKERKISRISVGQWCTEHGVKEKSYWYYHKKIGDGLAAIAANNLAPAAVGTLEFVPLEQPSSGSASGTAYIQKNGISIQVDDQVSDELLCRLLKAMDHV